MAGPIADDHPFECRHWDLAPEVGLLVLFPSRLDHSVLANGDPESLRCSISFDFVLTAPEHGQSTGIPCAPSLAMESLLRSAVIRPVALRR